MTTDDVEAGGPLLGGRYRLLRLLATGGMAEVYLARERDAAGDRLVVVKRTLPELAHSESALAMFRDEARLLAALHHPNIVEVHDAGSEGDTCYYVMEHLDGMDVGRMRRALQALPRGLPVEHAVTIVLGAAAGLHAAHEARDGEGRLLDVVHRDVSPGNVVVTFDGRVKLIDFGVARSERREAVTAAGVVKGTIAFMSPEQLLCQPLDRRSDVFSLGILLHELTCGRPLFNGDSAFQTMQQILKRPVPRPSELVAAYPRALEAVVMRALARRAEDRFASASDLALALEEVCDELGIVPSSGALGRFLRDLVDGAPAAEEASSFDQEDTVLTIRPAPDHTADTEAGLRVDELFEESTIVGDDAAVTVEIMVDVAALDAAALGRGRGSRRATTVTEVVVSPALLEAAQNQPTMPAVWPRGRSGEGPAVQMTPPRFTASGTTEMPRLVPRPDDPARRRPGKPS